MLKEICFDMDGTIADLYGVDGWLNDIINKSARPYKEAKPLVNLSALARRLNSLQKQGYKLTIISWLAKTTTKEYDKLVTSAKLNWLKKHLPSVQWDSINIIPYGTPKAMFGNGILFDDEEPNRIAWEGQAYDVENILEILKNL